MTEKAAKLKSLFETKKVVRIMGAHDGLGAYLIEKSGFDGVWASGLEISTSHLVPDANILTMTDNFLACQTMNDATQLPVVCDCDTGYGNVSNVIHMIKKYEAAGLAAVVVEDKRFPKVNSFVPGRQELASINEFCGKIEASIHARRDPDFMFIARIEAFIAGWGIDEALKRAYAYEDAGADALVIHSALKDPAEIYAFAKAFKGKIPLVAIPTTYFHVTADELAEQGYKMVIYANQGLRASIRAMKETFKVISEEGTTRNIESQLVGLKEVFELQGMNRMKDDEKKYLKTESIQAIIPAAGDHKTQGDLSPLLKDNPLCMLNIAGKPLISRQAEILQSSGVIDITVVGGYQFSKIKASGIKVIENTDFQKTHSAHSVMFAEKYLKSKNLIVYGDIVFDQQVLDQLIHTPYSITLAVDTAYRSLPFRKKELDLVALDNPAKDETARRLSLNTKKPILKIGKHVEQNGTSAEFIGLAYFDREGTRQLIEAWHQALKQFSGKPFYEASSVERASFTDLIQFLIDRKVPVYGMEIEHGWSEVHSLEDYNRVNEYFTKPEKVFAE